MYEAALRSEKLLLWISFLYEAALRSDADQHTDDGSKKQASCTRHTYANIQRSYYDNIGFDFETRNKTEGYQLDQPKMA